MCVVSAVDEAVVVTVDDPVDVTVVLTVVLGVVTGVTVAIVLTLVVAVDEAVVVTVVDAVDVAVVVASSAWIFFCKLMDRMVSAATRPLRSYLRHSLEPSSHSEVSMAHPLIGAPSAPAASFCASLAIL